MAWHSSVQAQINGQTPQTGLNVCGNGSTLSQGIVPGYFGPAIPGSCLAAGARNPFWYVFTVNCSGTLGFTITPNNLSDDYDFVLMDITGLPPANVFSNAPTLSCNYSGYTGITGAVPGGTGNSNGANGPNTNGLINVTPGMMLALCVSHYTASNQSGYTIEFTGGTCTPSDLPRATFDSARVSLCKDFVEAYISRTIKCNSIAANGSDFYLMPGNIAVTGATGVGCGPSAFTNRVQVGLPATLAPGNYTLHVKNGTDGNNLIDVCDSAFTTGNNVAFTVTPKVPGVMLRLTRDACNPKRVAVKFDRRINCSSLTATGSDFTLTGPATYHIVSATGINCASGFTDSVILNLDTNIIVGGTYTIGLQNGTDGNRLIDTCGLELSAAGNLTFTAVDGVRADFTIAPGTYCPNTTAVGLTGSGTNVTTYNWSFGDATTAAGMNQSKTYTAGGTFPVKLVTGHANGCKDSVIKNVVIQPLPVPVITIPDSVQCLVGNSFALTNNSHIPAGTMTYTWTAGDGAAAETTTNITHSYAAIGTYPVKLIAVSNNGCIDSITKNVRVKPMPAVPAVTTPVSYCKSAPASPLVATPDAGGTLNWYTDATGGTGSATAPTPATTTPGVYKWYVSQTVEACEGKRDSIIVTIIDSAPRPTVTTPISFCQYGVATVLTATPAVGGTLHWYTDATGGTALAAAPVPVTTVPGAFKWYVSQTLNGCEGGRDSITVNIINKPAVPAVTTPVAYCQFTTATLLSSSPLPGGTLGWYTAVSGGSPNATAPTPVTTAAGVFKWYVSQTINGCESDRDSITVTIKAKPARPGVTTPVSICQFATATALNATPASGGSLNWYTLAVGGAASGTAPVPVTTTAGTFKWYVSQTVNGCEGDRDSITMTVKPKPGLPTVTTPVSVCQAVTASALSATAASGGTLNWYTQANGGTASGTAPVPSTTNAGTFKWYVSQTVNGCEGDRDSITVTVKPKPAAPTAGSNSPLCTNPATVLNLTASTVAGATYAWTGPSSFTSAVQNPSITNPLAAATGTYSVTATVNGCTSNAGTTAVTVYTTPNPPTTAAISYCQNATAVALTATGSNLKWYANSTGGPGSATAPVPSTAVPGTYTFYVSQTTNNCEGNRASLVVTIKPLPPAPAVVTPVEYCQQLPTDTLKATPLTGNTLKWYNANPTALTGVPTPSSMVLGTFKWYVSQIQNGCEGPKDSIFVKVKPVPDAAMIVSADSICAGDSVLVEFAANAPATSTITWTATGKSDIIGRGPWQMDWTTPGSKVITVQAEDDGCFSDIWRDSVYVKLRPDASFNLSDACEDHAITAIYSGSNPSSGIQYSWVFEGNPWLVRKTMKSYEATWKKAGTYKVQLQTSNGNCVSDVVTKEAVVHPAPVLVLTESRPEVCYKDTFAVYAEGATKYTWSPAEAFVYNNDDAASRLVIMNQPWTIRVTGETPYGCIDSTSIDVKPDICCKDLLVPNAFTPNADGKNDVFRPLLMGRLSQYTMRITNRFGNVVFESNDPNKGWDGEGWDIGTYFYIIKAKCYDDVDVYKKGDITLIR